MPLILWVGVFRALGLYAPYDFTRFEEFRRTLSAAGIGLIVIILLTFWFEVYLSRSWMAITLAIVVALELGAGVWRGPWCHASEPRGSLALRTLVVGNHEDAHELSDALDRAGSGFLPLACVDVSMLDARGSARTDEQIGALRTVLREFQADCVFVAATHMTNPQMADVMRAARQEGVVVRVFTHLPGVLTSRVTLKPIAREGVALTLKLARLSATQRVVKRAMDLALAGFGLVVLSPLLLAVAIAIKATSRGPVLFSQERVTEGGRPFRMYKFRTMTTESERCDEEQAIDTSTPYFKIKDDPRVTKVGIAAEEVEHRRASAALQCGPRRHEPRRPASPARGASVREPRTPRPSPRGAGRHHRLVADPWAIGRRPGGGDRHGHVLHRELVSGAGLLHPVANGGRGVHSPRCLLTGLRRRAVEPPRGERILGSLLHPVSKIEAASLVVDRAKQATPGAYVCLTNVHTTVESHRSPALRAAVDSALPLRAGRHAARLDPPTPRSPEDREDHGHRVHPPRLRRRAWSDGCGTSSTAVLPAWRRKRAGEGSSSWSRGCRWSAPRPRRSRDIDHGRSKTSRGSSSGTKPHILWVGLGAPKQELWMARMSRNAGRPGDDRGRRRDRLPRRSESPRADHPAARGPRMAVQTRHGAKRLWRRYLLGNATFIYLLGRSVMSGQIERIGFKRSMSGKQR